MRDGVSRMFYSRVTLTLMSCVLMQLLRRAAPLSHRRRTLRSLVRRSPASLYRYRRLSFVDDWPASRPHLSGHAQESDPEHAFFILVDTRSRVSKSGPATISIRCFNDPKPNSGIPAAPTQTHNVNVGVRRMPSSGDVRAPDQGSRGQISRSDQMSSSSPGPAIIPSATCSVRPRIAFSSRSFISGFSRRKFLAFSRPCPIRTES